MSRVALIGTNTVQYIYNLLDIWNNGDCAVLIDYNMPVDFIIEIIKEANVKKIIIEHNILLKIKNFYNSDNLFNNYIYQCYDVSSSVVSEVPTYIYNLFKSNYTNEEALILYSSGTTGKAKGVILSHEAINYNSDAIIKYMNLGINDCLFIVKKFSHSSTIVGELLVALKKRIRLIISNTVVHPRTIIKNIINNNVTIICINPQLLELLNNEYKVYNNVKITSLRKIYCSGSLLNVNLLKEAKITFENIKIYNVYGLTEAGPRVSAQSNDHCTENSVGTPIEGVEVAILDKEGNKLNVNQYGIVNVKTNSLFLGYVNCKEKEEQLIEGYINTGDIGYFDINGELFIISRDDEMIIIDSQNIYPYDIEKAITTYTTIKKCVVTSISILNKEYLVCLYEGEEDKYNIIKKLKDKLLPYEIPKLFYSCKSIPHNENGKISRSTIKSEVLKMYKESCYSEKNYSK